MQYDLIVKNARIPQDNRVVEAVILVHQGVITGIVGPDFEPVGKVRTIDAAGHLVLPGCIDSHTHIIVLVILPPLAELGL